ncbi:gamma-interferon-inducible lysosomal thiol reductase-like isoform X1 [Neltuma alba]|uniref:gamma-interferon-inducible lysosomal thiol reductase-like isoform X1 n=1 Tax=Neltuma alba TaxID=207710 RepID=UPI0010A43E6B|nr:gamma-interferon-inducible lysosomal thiol reductase-like isoform X1 [Prosopis alba]
MWHLCANHLNLKPDSIHNCYTTALGKKLNLDIYIGSELSPTDPCKTMKMQLILHNAEETLKLNPPPKYLPWVTVNNEPLFRDYSNVIKYICNAYRGNSKPGACKTTSSIPLSPSLCDPPNTKFVSP